MDDNAKGYGKPPKSGQFRKGQTGNPLGRPKKKPAPEHVPSDNATEAFMRREMYRQVTVKTVGGPKTIPFNEAAFQKLQVLALNGNRLALQRLLDWAVDQEREEALAENEFSESLKILKSKYQAILDKAELEDKAPPKLYPHPADIIYDRNSDRYKLIGPLNEEWAVVYERATPMRQHFLIKSEMLRRTRPEKKKEVCPFQLMALLVDQEIPPSCRWTELKWVSLVMDYERLSDKALEVQAKTTFALATKDQGPMTSKEFKALGEQSALGAIFVALYKHAAVVESQLEKCGNTNRLKS